MSAIFAIQNGLPPAEYNSPDRSISGDAGVFANRLAQLQANEGSTAQITPGAHIKKDLDGIFTVNIPPGTKIPPAEQDLKLAELGPDLPKQVLDSLGYDLKNNPDLAEQYAWLLTYDEYDYTNTPYEGLAGNVFGGSKRPTEDTRLPVSWFAGVDPNEINALVKLFGFSGENERKDLYTAVVVNEVAAKLMVSQFPAISYQDGELLSEKASLDVHENQWLYTFANAFERNVDPNNPYRLIRQVTGDALVNTMQRYGINSQQAQDQLAAKLIDTLYKKPGILQRFENVLETNDINADNFIRDFKADLDTAMKAKADEIRDKLSQPAQ